MNSITKALFIMEYIRFIDKNIYADYDLYITSQHLLS